MRMSMSTFVQVLRLDLLRVRGVSLRLLLRHTAGMVMAV